MSDDQLKNELMNLGPDIHRAEVSRSGWAIRNFNSSNTKFIHNLKKKRARILTILHERKMKRNAR